MSRQCTQGCRAGSRVVDVRESFLTVRRRRQCRTCGHRWTTYEVIENSAELLEEVKERLEAIQQGAGNAGRAAGHTIDLIRKGKPNGKPT